MDGKAKRGVTFYHFVQPIIIVCGVLIPVLEGTSYGDKAQSPFGVGISVVGLLGLVVAILTALTRFFGFEERWQHYRKNAEMMRSEGDDFFALSGNYKEYTTHNEAFRPFIASVTAFKRQEVGSYFVRRYAEEQESKNEASKQSGNANL